MTTYQVVSWQFFRWFSQLKWKRFRNEKGRHKGQLKVPFHFSIPNAIENTKYENFKNIHTCQTDVIIPFNKNGVLILPKLFSIFYNKSEAPRQWCQVCNTISELLKGLNFKIYLSHDNLGHGLHTKGMVVEYHIWDDTALA